MDKNNNQITDPKHYDLFGKNTIDIIASSMTVDEWRGFCLGNVIKYRLRMGKKDSIEKDLGKAENYEVVFDKYKHLCREA